MSWRVQSQISTWKPSALMRRTRSAKGRSTKTISALTARVNGPTRPRWASRSSTSGRATSGRRGARGALLDRLDAVSAISSAARASSPATGLGSPARTARQNAGSSAGMRRA